MTLKIKTLLLLLCVFFISCSKSQDAPTPKQPPIPNFFALDTVVSIGTYVNFKSTSFFEVLPTYFEWHFEGGDPEYIYSAIKTNSHINTPIATIYNNVGKFSVSLTVLNDSGDSTLTKVGYITVVENTKDIKSQEHGQHVRASK
ncbi:MAG: PKD domain-containing protein [Bacteroidales bacterium]